MHYRYVSIDFHLGGMYFLWIAVALGLWSAVDYHARVYRAVRSHGRSTLIGNVDSPP
jgi:hypothetical protein